MEENDITEQKIKSIKYADFAKLSEYLAMYFALNNTCSDSDLLEENISFVKEHQPEKFERIQSKIEAMWTDAVLFPVGAIENEPEQPWTLQIHGDRAEPLEETGSMKAVILWRL